jgi:cytochrome bd-type quinol oxidase subunit 1
MTGTVTALNLARAQFAFTIAIHFIFPASSIGLAGYLAALETGRAAREGEAQRRVLTRPPPGD